MHHLLLILQKQLQEEYNQWALWYATSFMIGILYYFVFGYNALVLAISLVFLIRRRFFLFWIIVYFCFGISVAALHTRYTKSCYIAEQKIPLVGIVESVKPTDRGTIVVLQTELEGKIRIKLAKEHFFKIFAGDKIKIKAQIFPLREDFLGGKYLKISGINAVGYSLSPPEIIVARESNLQIIRKYIYKVLTSTMNEVEGNIAAAIMLGEQGGIKREVLQDMRYAGISHILCVSGLHLSLIAGISFLSFRFILNLFDFIAFNVDIKLFSAAFSLITSYIYLLLTGGQVAATRAFIMTAVMMIAIGINRTGYPIRSLSIAAGFILLMHPAYILHPSFQLSFIAVLSLISGFEFFLARQEYIAPSSSKLKLYIASNVYSSIIAGFATSPIVLYHFFIFSNYSVLANVIAVPMMSFVIMPVSLLIFFLLPLHLEYYPIKILELAISTIVKTATFVVEIPFSVINFGYITNTSIMLYLLGLFWVCLWKTNLRLYGYFFILLSVVLMLHAKKPDLILDLPNKTVAVQENDQLVVYSRRSNFSADYWTSWFGQKVTIHKRINLKNQSFKMRNGQRVKVLFQRPKYYNDKDQIVINTTGQKIGNCKNQITVNSSDIIMIFCEGISCKTKFWR